jgi:microcin C transport system substrate-binding protein
MMLDAFSRQPARDPAKVRSRTAPLPDLRPLWVGALALSLAALGTLAFAQETETSAEAEVPFEEITEGEIIKSHGYSFYGDLKYPADFEHFDFVNPDAPKGGELSLARLGTFDSMNPYTRKGRSGAYAWSIYESLLAEDAFGGEGLPGDVYGEYYGLLAESLEYDEGKNWVIFHMRPEAKFSDGTPVTAHDVAFSHNLLLDQGLESYAKAVRQRIPKVEVIDDHTIKFYFTPGISRRSLIDQVGFVTVWSKKWYEETGARLDESRLEISPGSGPYVLDNYDVNRSITYRRNPDYWGWDLAVNKGRYNYDTIRVEYFADDAAAFEAFKAGEYLFRPETNSKKWASQYDFPAVSNGYVVKEEIKDGSPPTPTGFVFNLGREKLQDKRVRQALALAYNFEWTNESLQYGLFAQRSSYSEGTEVMAKGVPEGAELAFLESLGDLVPPDLLVDEAVVAHTSDGSRLNDRRNLRTAANLLEEAGWTVNDAGERVNADGERLTIDFIFNSSNTGTLEAILTNYANNVESLGIDFTLNKVDPSQYTLLERDREYDMVYDSYASFLGAGTGLMQRYGSEAAAYSLFNPAGLASPLVDATINAALEAETREEEVIALTVLDRVLRYEMIMVPVWYNDTAWYAYWDIYAHPEELPPFAQGALDFWWVDPAKEQKLKDEGVLK